MNYEAFVLPILLVLIASCSDSKPESIEHVQDTEIQRTPAESLEQDTIFYSMINVDFDTLDPIAFLELLKIRPDVNRCIRITPNFSPEDSPMGNRIPEDWIKLDHLPLLVELVADTTQTVPVLSNYANMSETSLPNSTVSIEALRILDGNTKGRYPSLWPEYFHSSLETKEFEQWKSQILAPYLDKN